MSVNCEVIEVLQRDYTEGKYSNLCRNPELQKYQWPAEFPYRRIHYLQNRGFFNSDRNISTANHTKPSDTTRLNHSNNCTFQIQS